jgi:pimeloyl-ACP methyl ester carboxylesterase
VRRDPKRVPHPKSRPRDPLRWRENRTVTSNEAKPERQDRSRDLPRPTPVSTLPPQFDEWQIELHGRRVIYRVAGNGPPVVLIHGMLNSSSHWRSVALNLARHYTVIAPDLIGHGDSAAPRGDYSLGAHASSIRDLLAAIGIDRASIVGHSLGGGVAMQFFYQFPQRTERLVLISSGGLGQEVSPVLRTAALPGISALLSMTIHPRLLGALMDSGRRLRKREVRLGVYMQALARALRPLENAGARQAFLQTLRAVIDVHGQRVSATDRLYLLESTPTMIVWGERDNTIPLQHGREAHAAIPHSYFKTLPRAAHFPHLEDPEGLSDALREFFSATQPCMIDDADWGAVLARHSPPRRVGDAAA